MKSSAGNCISVFPSRRRQEFRFVRHRQRRPSKRVFAGRICGRPERTRVLRPGLPDPPPANRKATRTRRSERIVTSAGIEKFELADDAVAAAMRTRAPGSCAHAIAFDAQRILMFECLDRSVPAIGHVRVRGASPSPFADAPMPPAMVS